MPLLRIALLALVMGPLFGCLQAHNSKDRTKPGVATPPPGETEKTPQSSHQGSSTGGGSFGDESSLTILKWASTDLANQIRNSSPEIYKGLPNGWTQEKLAQIISDVKPTNEHRETYQIPEVNRYGKRLMFNYGYSEAGKPYLTVTRLFVDSYSHYDVNSRPIQGFGGTLAEVKLKLIHEASHLMGYGLTKETDETEARAFAKALLASLDSDNVECLPKSPPPKMIYTPFEVERIGIGMRDSEADIIKKSSPFTRAYVFNRPSGRAAAPTNVVIPTYREVRQQNGSLIIIPNPIDYTAVSSGRISVFAPRSYDEKFDLPSIRRSIFDGVRIYGNSDGCFSWDKVDLRRAVFTQEGYRSNYKYSRENDLNNEFSDYLDFFVMRSSSQEYEIETYPPLSQDEDNWNFYRSQGKARIFLKFEDGKIIDSYLTVLADFSRWLDAKDKEPNEYAVKVPLQCVRSFKPLLAPSRK